jgi:hypothetical protein
MEEEIIKPIIDFPNYRISNFGNVYSLRKNKLYLLKLELTKKGYYRIRIVNDVEHKRFLVHKLVAIHFVDKVLDKNEINHINGIKTYNYYKNLEWCTRSENTIHAYKTGLEKKVYSINHHNCKLTKENVIEIRKMRKETNLTLQKIANKFNVERSTIGYIVNNKFHLHD